MSVQPVFVLSLPRSGSTLLQRVLGTHREIATASEPWLLLPLLGLLDERLPGAGPRHHLEARAIADFARTLPGGVDDLRRALRTAALQLYEGASTDGARLFVDKTPLYHLIVDELVATFPDARFIFLWRNPLAVVASVIELLSDGRWTPNRHVMSLFLGLENLIDAWRRHGDRSHAVRFEDVANGNQAVLNDLFGYLGVPFDPSALEQIAEVRLDGRMGDPGGMRRYAGLSTEPFDKWRRTIRTPVRRWWLEQYLGWIGRERLGIMGYELDKLLAELSTTRMTGEGTLTDARLMATSLARELARARIPPYAAGPSTWRRLLGT